MAAEDEEDIYNLVTMEVMAEKVSRDILKWDEIGQRMLVEFTCGMALCMGQNDNEEAQNIQNIKCHDRNDCWLKAYKDQIGEWIVAETGRHLKKSTIVWYGGMRWTL